MSHAELPDPDAWNITPSEAVEVQKRLREQVRIESPKKPLRLIAGADISFNKYSPVLYAGIVVIDRETLETVEEAAVEAETTFPYVPGLLSFREIPPLLKVWRKLKSRPDVVMLDGHGIAHPRRLGIASHFGILIDQPTIGCGKSVLVGKFEEPLPERGAWTPLTDRGETIGAALRTKNRVKPVFVSTGHRIDLEHAVQVVLDCNGGYRLPEPTRRAHNLVNAVRRGERAG